MNSLQDIHFVLCHPEDPRNVGGAIRGAANAGIGSIRIVTTVDFDERDIFCYSSGALDLSVVQSYPTVAAAVADCHRVIGTSRRVRDPDAPPQWPASGLIQRLNPSSSTAILFGTERTGLVRSELELCSALVYIPTSSAFPSMNLAHAVACLGYELARPAPETVGPQSAEPAPRLSASARDAFFGAMHETLVNIGYPPGRNPAGFIQRFRKILHRANLNQQELSMFGGLFAELARLHRAVTTVDRAAGCSPVSDGNDQSGE
ncbi:MAG: TrmH family RNA methyltransferase [Myxococcota bacterium]|nr:TrmH family RNA methyltransferase [Myxococcota bacterium]